MNNESGAQTLSIRLSPSSLTTLHEPSKCERRAWLRRSGTVTEADPSGFQQFLFDQGIVHEKRVEQSLVSLGIELTDLSPLSEAERVAATRESVKSGGPGGVSQGQLLTEFEITGRVVEVTGRPDFLYPEDGTWVIADAKSTRKVHSNGKERSEKRPIFLQMRLYGMLFEASFPGVPFELRVHNGTGGVEVVNPEGTNAVVEELARFLHIVDRDSEPYEQVGWSKCLNCGFRTHCWPQAEEAGDLGLLPSISQSKGVKLRAIGLSSVTALLGENPAHAEVPEGAIEEALAMSIGAPVPRIGDSGSAVPIDPAVTADRNYVMFDLEGLPPELDLPERVYLWGMQVFGDDPGPFVAALAGFDEDGDRVGWEAFLREARSMINAHPGIRFVHWAPYERTMIRKYVERYGDDADGTAAEVEGLLLDLLPIAKRALAIPAPSYSLKVVEKLEAVRELTGFSRSETDVAKGDDSIVAFSRAVETTDEAERELIMQALCDYNREDLEATWAVQRWLRSLVEGDR